MEEQKKQIIQFVQDQKMKGYTITESLNDLKIKRSTYYAWLKPKDNKKDQKDNGTYPGRKTND